MCVVYMSMSMCVDAQKRCRPLPPLDSWVYSYLLLPGSSALSGVQAAVGVVCYKVKG